MGERVDQHVHPNERVDSFLGGKLQLIQSLDYFNFSIDALLLAHFISLPKRSTFKYVDFCSGNGVIPLLLAYRTEATLLGVEIQAPLVDMATRSIQLNQLEDRVSIIQGDLRTLTLPDCGSYDIVSCNPPYFLVDHTNSIHRIESIAQARHEITLSMEDWVRQAARHLKYKGKLYIVHRPERLDDLFEMLLNYHLAVHRIQFIYPKESMRANGVLIEAINHGGRRGVKVEPPIIVHQTDNSYTTFIKDVYNNG